jgi:hypothetical protein
MAATAFADAIEAYGDTGGATSFDLEWLPEEAGQTFPIGVPVQVNATDGGVQLWDGTTLAAGIAGFSVVAAQNLGTTGAGAAAPFGPITGLGSNIGNYAANSTQSLAVISPPGVPISIGLSGFAVAAPETVFIGKLGTSLTNPGPVATTNQTVGLALGLTKDTLTGFWYVDVNKTGATAAVRVIGLGQLEAVGTVGGHVLFVVLNAVAQIFS